MSNAAKQAADIVTNRIPHLNPKIGIILGSGLGPLADSIQQPEIISYDKLPGFPRCNVEGHHGELHIGTINDVPVACLKGRAHYYEGASDETFKTMIRTLKLIGCETLLATNSSGSLRETVRPGSLVVIRDHINYQGRNILVGPNDDEFGPRFVGMEDTYDAQLREQLKNAANNLDISLTEGVYFAVLGPIFETPAEIRAYAKLGGEVIGMSTVPEVLVARHCGMRVAVVSVITNMAAGMDSQKLSHELTLSGAEKGRDKLIALILKFLKVL